MPSGVEHPVDLDAYLGHPFLIFVSMPSGVEHEPPDLSKRTREST